MEIAVATVFYQACLPYLKDYIKALQSQTLQKFELLAFNDGVTELKSIFQSFDFSGARIIDVIGNPIEIREQVFSYLNKENFKYYIFLDADDYTSTNRIEDAIILLQDHMITFCNLSLINQQGELLSDGFWSGRLHHGQIITQQDIRSANCIGLGNAAIRKEALQKIKLPKGLLIADWFIFHFLLNDYNAIFSNSSTVFYRQHAHNIGGLKQINLKRLHHIIKVKENYYYHLKELFDDFTSEYDDILRLKARLNSARYAELAIENLRKLKINLFWWEETNYLNEN